MSLPGRIAMLAFLAVLSQTLPARAGNDPAPLAGESAPGPADVPEDMIGRLYESPGIVRTLMALEAERRTEDIISAIRGISDGHEMKSALLWLRGRVMADDLPDPRYALLYSESLLRVIGTDIEENRPLMETAAMVYLYGRLALMADAERCVNRQGAEDLAGRIAADNGGLLTFYRSLPAEKRRDILGVAMRLEERVAGRRPNEFMCRSEEPPKPAPGKPQASTYRQMEKELFSLMDDLEIDPRFVSRKVWLKRRETLREDFARTFR